jgi:hypothetical protein
MAALDSRCGGFGRGVIEAFRCHASCRMIVKTRRTRNNAGIGTRPAADFLSGAARA